MYCEHRKQACVSANRSLFAGSCWPAMMKRAGRLTECDFRSRTNDVLLLASRLIQLASLKERPLALSAVSRGRDAASRFCL